MSDQSVAEIVFQALAVLALVGLFGYFITVSVLRKRMQPGLWLCIACLSIFWIEAPYDWSMYAQFSPEIAKLPDWGPFGATYGGLIWLAPGGYVLYFVVPTLISLAISNWLRPRTRMTTPVRLLVVGLAVGMTWDMTWEIVGTRLGLWRFARTAPGLTLFEGTKYQVPVYVFLAMGSTIMVLTYLAGRLSDNGRTLFEEWAKRFSTPRRQTAATAFAFIACMHAFYSLTMTPHYIAKVAGWQTSVSDTPLYDDIPLQPK